MSKIFNKIMESLCRRLRVHASVVLPCRSKGVLQQFVLLACSACGWMYCINNNGDS